jgi:site-specific DNA-methyltransferase (adenine-specific)
MPARASIEDRRPARVAGARLPWPRIEAKPYFDAKDRGARLYHANSLELLGLLPEHSINMVFADPPYFLSSGGITCHAGRMVSVDKGEWDKPLGVEAMHKFNRDWLERCQRVLVSDGTIWVSGTTHVIFSVGFAMQELGFKILNDITWFKTNAPPNLSCRYFTHSTEHIIWAARGKRSKHKFDYQLMKQINDGKQMRDVWTLSAPQHAEKARGKHPTQKPLALLDRILRAASDEGDLILDPFAGSATTVVAAVLSGRRGIGVELEDRYLRVAVARLQDALSQPRLL